MFGDTCETGWEGRRQAGSHPTKQLGSGAARQPGTAQPPTGVLWTLPTGASTSHPSLMENIHVCVLCMSLCVCVCVCRSLCICVCVLCMCMCMCMCMCKCLSLPLCVSLCLSVSLCVLCVSLCLSVSLCVSLCLSVYARICALVRVCLCVASCVCVTLCGFARACVHAGCMHADRGHTKQRLLFKSQRRQARMAAGSESCGRSPSPSSLQALRMPRGGPAPTAHRCKSSELRKSGHRATGRRLWL